jgi:hypothetical protein
MAYITEELKAEIEADTTADEWKKIKAAYKNLIIKIKHDKYAAKLNEWYMADLDLKGAKSAWVTGQYPSKEIIDRLREEAGLQI